MPHTYIILFLIVLVVCLLTYVIPAGQFERQEDASGRMLIVPGTYTQVESSPVSPLEIPMAFVRTLGSSSVNEIIFFIFLIGGAFELIMQTGMITAFCAKLGKMFAGKEKLLIPIFITVFAVGGFTMGMSVEVLVFVPIGIAVAKAVGYDTITGTAMIAMGSIVGFTAGIYNLMWCGSVHRGCDSHVLRSLVSLDYPGGVYCCDQPVYYSLRGEGKEESLQEPDGERGFQPGGCGCICH